MGWELLLIFYVTVAMEGFARLPTVAVDRFGLECTVVGFLKRERLNEF